MWLLKDRTHADMGQETKPNEGFQPGQPGQPATRKDLEGSRQDESEVFPADSQHAYLMGKTLLVGGI